MVKDGVLYAFTDRSCIIKLVGAVKYTTVATDFERFIDDLVERAEVNEVLIDMRECTYIDSTDLGILARITVSQMHKGAPHPVLLYKKDSDIGSILNDVGFSRVFKMVEDISFEEVQLQEMVQSAKPDQMSMAKLMLNAHQLLIDLDEGNREKFSTVVDFMKQSVDSLSKKGDEQ